MLNIVQDQRVLTQNEREQRWFNMPIAVQLANVGGEVDRAIRWKNKNDSQKADNFCNKAIDFLELSIRDPKNKGRVDELTCAVDELRDYFLGDNSFGTTDEVLIRYYDAFLPLC